MMIWPHDPCPIKIEDFSECKEEAFSSPPLLTSRGT